MDSVQAVVFLLSLYIVVYIFFFMPSQVLGASMEPTLHTNDRIIINEFVYRLHSPDRGDIIVLKSPGNPDISYIKRVVGLPGDRVEIENGSVYINDIKMPEPFPGAATHTWEGGGLEENKEYTVPTNSLFVLGDNRPRSSDSREFGFIPLHSVEGQAIFRYFPPDEIGPLTNPYPTKLQEE